MAYQRDIAAIAPAVDKALAALPPRMDTPQARVLLYAIGLQESRLKHRDQIVKGKKPGVKGPALGLWQFERGGGVRGVLRHPASAKLAAEAISHLVGNDGVIFERAVWLALEQDDVLAAKFARLLLWTDPRPLPARGHVTAAWDCYIRNWRPGKPHPQTWAALYRAAEEFVYGSAQAD
jgi:hypothetical protein